MSVIRLKIQNTDHPIYKEMKDYYDKTYLPAVEKIIDHIRYLHNNLTTTNDNNVLEYIPKFESHLNTLNELHNIFIDKFNSLCKFEDRMKCSYAQNDNLKRVCYKCDSYKICFRCNSLVKNNVCNICNQNLLQSPFQQIYSIKCSECVDKSKIIECDCRTLDYISEELFTICRKRTLMIIELKGYFKYECTIRKNIFKISI